MQKSNHKERDDKKKRIETVANKRLSNLSDKQQNTEAKHMNHERGEQKKREEKKKA